MSYLEKVHLQERIADLEVKVGYMDAYITDMDNRMSSVIDAIIFALSNFRHTLSELETTIDELIKTKENGEVKQDA